MSPLGLPLPARDGRPGAGFLPHAEDKESSVEVTRRRPASPSKSAYAIDWTSGVDDYRRTQFIRDVTVTGLRVTGQRLNASTDSVGRSRCSILRGVDARNPLVVIMIHHDARVVLIEVRPGVQVIENGTSRKNYVCHQKKA